MVLKSKHQRQHEPYPSLKLFFGGIAACVAKSAVAPLERARIIAQTGSFTGGYAGLYRQILKTEGVTGLFRGNAVNCMRQFPSKSLLFWANDFWRDRFREVLCLDAAAALPFAASFTSGSLAGCCATFLTYPLDVMRTKISTANFSTTGTTSAGPNRAGFLEVARSTFAHGGVRSFYKGIHPTLLGVFPYEGLKFSVYNQAKQLVRHNFVGDDARKIPTYWSVFCGAVAGICAGG